MTAQQHFTASLEQIAQLATTAAISSQEIAMILISLAREYSEEEFRRECKQLMGKY